MKRNNLLFFILLLLIFSGCSSVKIDRKERISRYFILGEAINSRVAKKKNIKNIPSSGELKNIRYTAKRMDEVRKILNRPIIVTSWYRSSKLNRAVSGSKTSAHMDGLAVDFMLKRGKYGRWEFARLKKKLKSFDQMIYYPRRGHLHIGFRKSKWRERREVRIWR